MTIRRSTVFARVSTRFIISAIAMLVGIIVLARACLGDVGVLFYAGLGLVLLGVIPALAFGILGNHFYTTPSRKESHN
jgi:hypothetical protein